MKTISIHVAPNLADSFEKADETKKRKAEIYINAWLNDFFSEQTANEKLLNIMKKSSGEAKANGFDSTMIDDIINGGE